jgi:hypothetical protein
MIAIPLHVEEPSTTSFIARWSSSGAAERANYQLFLSELCDLLGVARPDQTKPDDADNAYVFERSVTFHHPDGSTSTGRIDLYKRGCYVLEAKQGVEKREAAEALADATKAKAKAAKKGHAQRGSAAWDEAMLKARGQAEQYARALPASEGRPPLLIIVDVGHSIELYSEFTRTGGTYVPFPDPQSHRILLAKLNDADVRETLRLAWTDPQALDPARRSARVTREIASSLGRLAASLEKSGHSAEAVATFLMRALFTMFAEDVELLPKDSFINLLKSLHGHTDQFVPMIEELWSRMKTGGFSTVLREKVRHFNGGLFEQATALPLTDDQFELLIEASRADWREVEPAIFGTLLERALNPIERHKLGAHYTPRAYVERLVMPTVVEPLRAEWDAAKAAAVTLDRQGKTKDAAAEVQRFHRRLCEVRVLDPACGSGNFLYVTLEHLKRLEGEVLNALDRLGHEQAALEMAGFTVDPHQLLGLEVNPRAAAIAELVLWIGYLQWHFRTRGRVAPPEPIIKNFHNIENRDAVLAYDRTEPVLDEKEGLQTHGQPVTRWDGRTMKKHPVTGEDVPDETARVPLLSYVNPRPTEWPQADFIVGNPPFMGKGKVRDALGDGYVETLREMYPDVPDSADFVMYWWHKAALLVREGKVARFGFITTNSLRQTFNRRVVAPHFAAKNRLSLVFAIPDHPWVDSADGAAVRIAMTVGIAGATAGDLHRATDERASDDGSQQVTLACTRGLISADLSVGADTTATVSLQANKLLSSTGLILGNRGFVLTRDEAEALKTANADCAKLIFPLRNGDDINGKGRDAYVIDTNGWTEEDLNLRVPEIYQRLRNTVYPERQENRDPKLRKYWWLFRRSNEQVRAAIAGLPRFIATVETAKHRIFTFLAAGTKPEHKLIVIGLDDAYFLGVLSSRAHLVYCSPDAHGALLEDRPVYVKTRCFETFPFPTATEAQQTRIRDLAKRLDAHRKRQQAQHPKLTLTDLYNVLEKLRAGTPLNATEQLTHEHGLVTVLRQLHDELDAAVAEAYALPPTATEDAILLHLCALNAQRAAEERTGTIRYVRSAFQKPTSTATQTTLLTGENEAATPAAKATAKLGWPKTFAEQALAVRTALTIFAAPVDAATLATTFKGAKVDRIEDILETLASLGQARALADEKYVAV